MTASTSAQDAGSVVVRADLRLVRWIAMAFLIVDSSAEVIGLVAPSAVGGQPPTWLDALQALVGLVACALVMWERNRWAVLVTTVLVALMLPRHLVGIEPGLLLVATATVSIRLRGRGLAIGLVAIGAFEAALVVTVRREGHGTWIELIAFYLTTTLLVVAVGIVVRRLGAEREANRRTLRQLHQERLQIHETERRLLATELESALTDRLDGMRHTLDDSRSDSADSADAADPADAESLRRVIAGLAASGRAMLADLRVVVQVLRDPPASSSTAPAVPTWIERLHTPRVRGLIAVVSLAAAVALAVGEPSIGRAVGVLSTLALALACWRRALGVAVAVMALGVGLTTPDLPVAAAAAVVVLAFAATIEGRWPRPIALTIGLLGYVTVFAARFGAAADAAVTVCELGALVGATVGITLRHFHVVGRQTAAGIIELRRHRAAVAQEERTQVARELHDVVGHQLSAVALHTLSTEGIEDPAALHGALDQIAELVATAEVELAALVGGLESASPRPTNGTPTMRTVPVSQVAAELTGRLRAHGFLATFDLDPAVDTLDATTAHTAIRFLQETSANALRYAAAGPCTFVVGCGDEVTLQARTPLAADQTPRSLPGGWGLRGLGERVELLGGRLSAGPDAGSWAVQAAIPTPRAAAASL